LESDLEQLLIIDRFLDIICLDGETVFRIKGIETNQSKIHQILAHLDKLTR
jgi:hypothetical protein